MYVTFQNASIILKFDVKNSKLLQLKYDFFIFFPTWKTLRSNFFVDMFSFLRHIFSK